MTIRNENPDTMTKPPVTGLYRWLLAGMLLCLPFAYDTGAFDVVSTKHFAWVVALSVLATLALLRDQLDLRLMWGMVVVVLCFVPTWWRGTELLLWWVPWAQAVGLLWWWYLLQTALPFAPSEPPLQHSTARWWLHAVTGSVLGMALLVYLQRWAPQWLPFWSGRGALVDGTFGNPNHLSAFLAVGLPVCLLAGPRRLWVVLLVLPALLWTGSRLGLLAAGVALLVGGVLLVIPKHRMSRREGWLVLVLVVLMVGASFVLSPRKNLRNLTSGWGGLPARLHLVKCAAPMLLEEGWWGVGWGRFRQTFPAHRGRCLAGSRYQHDPQHTVILNLHNDWMEVVIEGGWIGVMLWLLALCFLFRQLWRSQALQWRERVWLGMVFVAMAIQMAGHFPLQLPPVVTIVVMCWVLLAWSTRQGESPDSRNNDLQTDTGSRLASLRRWWRWQASRPIHWGLRFTLLWGWFLLTFVQWQAYRAERVFARADIALDFQAPEAMSLLVQSESHFPSMRVAFQKGQLLLHQDRPEAALHEFRKAMRWQPDAQGALYMAKAYIQNSQPEAAKAALLQGLRLRPGYPPLVRMLQGLTRQATSQPVQLPRKQ